MLSLLCISFPEFGGESPVIRVVGSPRPILRLDRPARPLAWRHAAGVRRRRISKLPAVKRPGRSLRFMSLEGQGHVHVESVLPELADDLPERLVAPGRDVATSLGFPGDRAVHAVLVVKRDRDQNPVDVHASEPVDELDREDRPLAATVFPGLYDFPVRSPIARDRDGSHREIEDIPDPDLVCAGEPL